MPLALAHLSPQTIRDFDSYFTRDLAQQDGMFTAEGTASDYLDTTKPLDWCEAPTVELVRKAASEMPMLLNANGENLFFVDDTSKRRESKLAHSVLFSGSMPIDAFRRVSYSLCIPSVELCFVQFASTHSFLESVVFGYELCGRYRIDLSASGGIRDAKPLTTPKRILEFASKMQGASGKRKAIRAAKYVLPNSKSPRESTTVILLCFPRFLGGHAIPYPLLNYELPGLDGVYCDALWLKARLALEYESYLWHTGRQRLTRDSKRRAILMSKGFDVITITNDQLLDVNAFDLVASNISSRLGIHLRANEPSRIHERVALRQDLQRIGCL